LKTYGSNQNAALTPPWRGCRTSHWQQELLLDPDEKGVYSSAKPSDAPRQLSHRFVSALSLVL
ncbi:MAG TPA: hypothetical protein PLZ16_10640, partial [Gammaproteobacteria bacterium]|nr:hypothetical protein [Gammaproteobacteria bacterium]